MQEVFNFSKLDKDEKYNQLMKVLEDEDMCNHIDKATNINNAKKRKIRNI